MTSEGVFGEVQLIPIADLQLDAKNPRFHPPVIGELSQHDLARRLAEEDDAIVVARSISRHGFYPWEVLVVVDENDRSIVVEGNRRLCALLGLTDVALRAVLPDKEEWEELARSAANKLDGRVPCVAARSRSAAQPALGYRHISGIAPWGPFAQARFIAHLIEDEGQTEDEVAEVTGKTIGWVRDVYRNYRVTMQAELWDLETSGIIDSFSLMDVALGQRGIKDYLGIGTSLGITPNYEPVVNEKKQSLQEVIALIWGDEDHDPVITDSRQIRRLGRIINDAAGLQSLKDGKSLDEAAAAAAESDYDAVEALVAKVEAATKAASAANREIRRMSTEDLMDERIPLAIATFRDEASQLIQAVDAD